MEKIKVEGGEIYIFENFAGSEYSGTTAMGLTSVFVPDARLQLAAQIAAGLVCRGYFPKDIVESAYIAADLLLKKSERTNQ